MPYRNDRRPCRQGTRVRRDGHTLTRGRRALGPLMQRGGCRHRSRGSLVRFRPIYFSSPTHAGQWFGMQHWQRSSSSARPVVMTLTAEGRAAFVGYVNDLYAQLADPELPDHLRGPYAKLEGYAARLALIL